MKKMITITLTLGLFISAIATLIDGYGQKLPSKSSYDAIIVAGCKVRSDGTPSLALQARTRKAIELYKMGYASKIIFTGGSVDERPSEAKAAMEYALSISEFPPQSLLLEEQSTTTRTNAQYAKEKYTDIDNIIVVSDSYHIYRAERIFEKYYSSVEGSGRVPAWNVRIKGAYREIPAILYYKWKGYL